VTSQVGRLWKCRFRLLAELLKDDEPFSKCWPCWWDAKFGILAEKRNDGRNSNEASKRGFNVTVKPGKVDDGPALETAELVVALAQLFDDSEMAGLLKDFGKKKIKLEKYFFMKGIRTTYKSINLYFFD
jgi:hypothetical protein